MGGFLEHVSEYSLPVLTGPKALLSAGGKVDWSCCFCESNVAWRLALCSLLFSMAAEDCYCSASIRPENRTKVI